VVKQSQAHHGSYHSMMCMVPYVLGVCYCRSLWVVLGLQAYRHRPLGTVQPGKADSCMVPVLLLHRTNPDVSDQRLCVTHASLLLHMQAFSGVVHIVARHWVPHHEH